MCLLFIIAIIMNGSLVGCEGIHEQDVEEHLERLLFYHSNRDTQRLIGDTHQLRIFALDGFAPLINCTPEQLRMFLETTKISPDSRIPNKDGKYMATPLMVAVWQREFTRAQILLDYGAYINAATSDGYTALHLACLYTQFMEASDAPYQRAKWLLEHKAKVNLETFQKRTALHLAIARPWQGVLDRTYKSKWTEAEGKQAKLVQLLIDEGSNLEHQEGVCGYYPIHFAHQSQIITLLIAAKADINAQATNGDTALKLRAEEGDIDCVQLLLDAKANPCIKNKEGKDAIDVARYPKIKELLMRYRADNTK